MRKFLLLVVFMVATSVAAWANACAPGTLASYEALGSGGCTIGSLLFSNFSYGPPGLAPLDSQVNVTLFSGGGETGFTLMANWTAPVNTENDYSLSYDVTVNTAVCPKCTIDDALLAMIATVANGGLGASISENSLNPPPNIALDVSTPPENCAAGCTATQSFTPGATSLKIIMFKDILVDGATITSITQAFSVTQVPEPASLALLGTALFGTGFLLRRRLSKKTNEE